MPMFIVYALFVASLFHHSLPAAIQGTSPTPTDVDCYARTGTLHGQCGFTASKGVIIRSQLSVRQGAEYLGYRFNVSCPRDCIAACCSSEVCDTVIYVDKGAHHCYLFRCGNPTRCEFSRNVDYWSISKSPLPPIVVTETRPVTTEMPRPFLTTTTQAHGSGDCDSRPVIPLTDDRGHIDFQLSMSYDCQEWLIYSPSNSTITLSFSHLNLGNNRDSDCLSGSHIIIGPVPYTVICQLNTKTTVYTSQRNHLWIKFFTKQYRDSWPSFHLKYISKPVWQCGTDEWTCNCGRCIYRDWLCNGVTECGDYSDELSCPVSDKTVSELLTMTVRPTSPPAMVRNGPKCGYNEVYCYVTAVHGYMCLHNMKKCDGHTDCQSGEDEDPAMCGNELCNLRLENPTGWFASPGFKMPGLYPNNMQCGWVIHRLAADLYTHIQLHFVTFHLQPDPDTDYVIVYDGPDNTYHQIGRYDGAHMPPYLIESSSTWLYITFHSDYSVMYNGFNITYQTKGTCFETQQKCGYEEMDCYDHMKRCDGTWDCPLKGGDELGCYNCHNEEYSCGVGTGQCYHPGERCNGVARCSNNADEQNCTPDLCGHSNGTFLCDNDRCIYESWTCDQRNDCGDDSDEHDCFGSTKRVIVAAITGSMICGLLLVILLGCSCKLYSLRTLERHGGPRHETPMSRLYSEFMRRIAPPPYHEAMLTSRNFDEVQQEHAERRARRSRRESSQANSGNQPVDGTNSELDTREHPGDAAAEVDIAEPAMEETAAGIGVDPPVTLAEPLTLDSETESADSDYDPDPGEVTEGESDDSLLISPLPSDTAHGSDIDNMSDDLCILQVEGRDFPARSDMPGDEASIDTATTSLDSVDVTETNIVVKDSDEYISDDEGLQSGTMPKPDDCPTVHLIPLRAIYGRRSSRGSVTSSESETFSTDDVPLVVFNQH